MGDASKRELGRSGLTVSAIGLGCMGMSEFYGPSDEQESLDTLHAAIEMGVTFWDTADMYGPHKNEELIGRALQGRRQHVTLATKFGIVRQGDERTISGRPEYVRQACDASLKRLRVDTIDLYYQHRVDPNVPIEETVGAMAGLVERGKVRYLGLSEAAPQTIRRAAKAHPIAALQTEYSLWSRDPEGELLATCRELGIGFVAYSPLGRGWLTGKIRSLNDLAPDDWRRNHPRFSAENFQANLRLVEAVEKVAREIGCSPAQVALAWLLAQGPDIVPIPGTRSAKRLSENWAAAQIPLTVEQSRQLAEACPAEAVKGQRYPEGAMKTVNL